MSLCESRSQVLTLLSAYHSYASRLLSQQATEVENLEQPPVGTQVLYRHRALVMASITASVMFLEARINEVFAEASRPSVSFLCVGMSDERCDALRQAWTPNYQYLPTLDKFDVALSVAQVGEIPKGEKLYGDVRLVVRLRNYLTHFNGEYMRVQGYDEPPLPQNERHLLERSLRGKFELCSLSGIEVFFPDQCLGASCSEWAWKATCAFVGEFSRRLGIIEPFSPAVVNSDDEG